QKADNPAKFRYRRRNTGDKHPKADDQTTQGKKQSTDYGKCGNKLCIDQIITMKRLRHNTAQCACVLLRVNRIKTKPDAKQWPQKANKDMKRRQRSIGECK